MIQSKNKQNKLKKQRSNSQRTELTFLEHLYELRNRLFWVVSALVLASALAFQFKDTLVDIVMAPLHGEQLVYLTPGGGFGFIFTLSIYFGALLAIPVFVYHIYKFLQPLMFRASRRFVATFILVSGFLASAGALFGYFVAIPAALNFLTTFAGDAVAPNLTADSYLGFVVAYVLGLAALFQIPLLLFLFDHVKPIPPGGLSSSQRFVIIGATVAAAIITPTPDALNMAIIAVPIIAVYELGAFVVFIRHQTSKRKKSKPKALVADEMVDELERARQRALRLRRALESQSDDDDEVASTEPVVNHANPQPLTNANQLASELDPVATPAKQKIPVRMMEGLAGGSRPSPMATTIIPVRGAEQPRPVTPSRIPSPRPTRSLDGFSTV